MNQDSSRLQIVPNTPSGPAVEVPRQVRRLMEKMKKKERKEANKLFLRDRYSYLRNPAPKSNHTSDNKGDK